MSSRIEIALQSLECCLQIGGALIPQISVLLQGLPNDPAELLRQRRIDLIHRHRISIEDGFKYDRRCLPLDGKDAGRHLIQDGAERKKVRARVRDLSSRLL